MPRHPIFLAAVMFLVACAPRSELVFLPEAREIGTSHTIFVATNRVVDPVSGVLTNKRSDDETYHRYDISIPPEHTVGKIEFPVRGERADPRKHFVTTAVDAGLSRAAFRAGLSQALREQPTRKREAMIYVHGFNNTLAEGLFRTAQLKEDLAIPGVPVHYAWPSAGTALGYVYDRDSSQFARDGLEELLRDVVASGVDRIILTAHSMGSVLAMETLRQIAQKGDRALMGRIGSVILFSPDIDVDVFRTQARIVAPALRDPIVVFSSQRDSILALSARVAGDGARLGNLTDPEEIARLPVLMFDVSEFGDGSVHFPAATSPTLLSILRRAGDIEASLAQDTDDFSLGAGIVLTFQGASDVLLRPVRVLGR